MVTRYLWRCWASWAAQTLGAKAIEAAENPSDLSEWADIQFLLWDARRRAGITDEQLTHAMITKLEQNKKRQWSEVKDGEPVNHVDDCWIEWAGGGCPIPGWRKVDVKFRDGDEEHKFDAESFRWNSTGSNDDIVAYKIVDGWINWEGGSRPVHGWQEVDVKFRDGDEAAQFKAEDLIWHNHGAYDDIVAYRLVK